MSNPEDLCIGEGTASNAFSPGPVEDRESLARLIISPIHYDMTTNSIDATAFDDVFTHGLSLNRTALMSPELLRSTHLAKMSADREREARKVAEGRSPLSREYVGYIVAICGEIRKILIDEIRAFCVIDSATKENPFHCEVKSTKQHNRLKLRNEIRSIFEANPLTLDDFISQRMTR